MSQLPTRHKHQIFALLVKEIPLFWLFPVLSDKSDNPSRESKNGKPLIQKTIYLQAVEPQSLQRPLKPSQQCFQQPEPHFVTSAGVREPGKKN